MSDPMDGVAFPGAGLTRRHDRVAALDGTDFERRAGEVMAVNGGNGAGKSILVEVPSGAIRPDDGEPRLDDETIAFRSPRSTSPTGSVSGASDVGPLLVSPRNVSMLDSVAIMTGAMSAPTSGSTPASDAGASR